MDRRILKLKLGISVTIDEEVLVIKRKAKMSEEMKKCQACGMPITKDEEKGTNADGSKNEDYCAYCLENGNLTLMCQSCGMPMKKDEDFGKEVDGGKNENYCAFCYAEGKFTKPDVTIEELVEIGADFDWGFTTNEDGSPLTKEQKLKMGAEYLPTLKRWRKEGQA